MKIKKLNLGILSGVVALATASTAVQAQLEEIVVTATKRTQSLQDIPLSVTAISGASLERSGIQDFEDIATSVPSLSFKSSGPGRTKLNIRGVSAATGFAPTVAYYVDEMPISSISSGSSTSFAQTVISPKLFDLDRIEVLRGPQGTIFGSSAMGGTVRLITGQPKVGESESRIGTELSNTSEGGNNFILNGMTNIPLGDSVALRLVGSFTENDGYIDRFVAGQEVEEDVNNESTQSVRASLRWEIDETSYIQPTIFVQNTEQDGKPNFDATATDRNSLRQDRDFDLPEPFEDEFVLSSLTFNKGFDTMSLVANVSNMDREINNVENISQPLSIGAGLPVFEGIGADELVELDDTTIEVRLSSDNDSSVQWVAGIYRKDVTVDAGYRMIRGAAPTLAAIGASVFDSIANTQDRREYEENSVFGEATWSINEAFDLTFGLRYLDYEFNQNKVDWGLVFGETTRAGATPLAVSQEDDDLNYRLTLAWNYDEASQVYLTSSNASRPGGGNRTIPRNSSIDPTLPPDGSNPADSVAFACNNDLNALGIAGSPDTFDSDDVQNLELGWKSDISDSLRLNAAAYQIQWNDVQQVVNTSGACGINFTSNLGEAETTGLEIEVTAAITDNFTVNAGAGFTDAEFTETVSLGGNDIITSGDRLADVPEVTVNVGADYIIPASNGEFFVIGNVSYVDETLEIAGDENTDVSGNGIVQGNVRPSYTLVDARFGYTSNSNWKLALFIDNLTDEEAYFAYQDVLALPTGTFDRTVRNRPRTVGLSFGYDF